MGLVTIMKRGGEDYRDYKKAVKMAKEAIDVICSLTEEMEDEYGYGERYGSRGYGHREGLDEGMDMRRGRDSMGRYR